MGREIEALQVLFRSSAHGAVRASGGEFSTPAAVRSPFESLRTNGQPRCSFEVVGSDFPLRANGGSIVIPSGAQRSGERNLKELLTIVVAFPAAPPWRDPSTVVGGMEF